MDPRRHTRQPGRTPALLVDSIMEGLPEPIHSADNPALAGFMAAEAAFTVEEAAMAGAGGSSHQVNRHERRKDEYD